MTPKNTKFSQNLFHQQVVAVAGDKQVIVSETGWPSGGNSIGNAIPSLQNAAFYFKNFVSWTKELNVLYFYFEAFDEPWKAKYEGSCGAHWGVWNKEGYLKSGMEWIFMGETIPCNWEAELIGGPGDPSISFTYIPPIGSYENLKGQVSHIKPVEFLVVVYIKVQDRWWIKPYANNPLTVIKPDGTWVCDITTGGIDQLATEIAAYLIPYNYSPPIVLGEVSLPSELNSFPNATVVRS